MAWRGRGQGGADPTEVGGDLGYRVGVRVAGVDQGLLGRADVLAGIALGIVEPAHDLTAGYLAAQFR